MPWRVFDFAERSIAPPLEELVQSDLFASGVARYLKLSRFVGDSVQGLARGVLTRANIPTSGDVQDLHRHIAMLEARLADLIEKESASAGRETQSAQASAVNAPSPATAPKPAAGRRASKPTSSARRRPRGSA